MRFSGYAKKLHDLAETLHRWVEALATLESSRRERVANYALAIAATLARAAMAMTALNENPDDLKAARCVALELGRVSGYVETMIGVLEHHLDGRKLAGVKRRLERLDAIASHGADGGATSLHIDRLVSAEGFFRAFADGLRV